MLPYRKPCVHTQDISICIKVQDIKFTRSNKASEKVRKDIYRFEMKA